MWIKAFAVVLMGGVLVGAVALVSQARRPGESRGLSSLGVGGPAATPVETISRGEAVRFEDHVTAGSHQTLFMFTADW